MRRGCVDSYGHIYPCRPSRQWQNNTEYSTYLHIFKSASRCVYLQSVWCTRMFVLRQIIVLGLRGLMCVLKTDPSASTQENPDNKISEQQSSFATNLSPSLVNSISFPQCTKTLTSSCRPSLPPYDHHRQTFVEKGHHLTKSF